MLLVFREKLKNYIKELLIILKTPSRVNWGLRLRSSSSLCSPLYVFWHSYNVLSFELQLFVLKSLLSTVIISVFVATAKHSWKQPSKTSKCYFILGHLTSTVCVTLTLRIWTVRPTWNRGRCREGFWTSSPRSTPRTSGATLSATLPPQKSTASTGQ